MSTGVVSSCSAVGPAAAPLQTQAHPGEAMLEKRPQVSTTSTVSCAGHVHSWQHDILALVASEVDGGGTRVDARALASQRFQWPWWIVGVGKVGAVGSGSSGVGGWLEAFEGADFRRRVHLQGHITSPPPSS